MSLTFARYKFNSISHNFSFKAGLKVDVCQAIWMPSPNLATQHGGYD